MTQKDSYSPRTIQEIKDSLLDANDGPVMEHTVIARAVEMIKESDYSGYEIGRAMYQALTELMKEHDGYISSNEFSNARAL
jgi:hypothetical protein